MTQEYVAGELSLRLGQLQAMATDRERAREVTLADGLCWNSLGCGDALAFSSQAAIGAELWGFGVCARLFEEDLELD